MSGDSVSVKKSGIFTTETTFSPTGLSGTWKGARFMSNDLNFTDPAGAIIAILKFTSFTPFELGKLQFPTEARQEWMGFVVVTCIAMIQQRSQDDATGSASEATNAGASAAAGPAAVPCM